MSTESRSWQPRARTVVVCNLAGACFGPLNVVLQTAVPFRRDGGEGVALTHSLTSESDTWDWVTIKLNEPDSSVSNSKLAGPLQRCRARSGAA